MTAYICDPKCAPIHNFGPVNVKVVRGNYGGGGGDMPEDDLLTRTVGSAGISCVYLMLGANTILIFTYSLYWHLSFFNNLHIFLCTSGFQLLIPLGILMQSKINGPSHVLSIENRIKQHTILQVLGALCGITGSVLVIIVGETSENNFFSSHCIVGCIACLFAVLSMISGVIGSKPSKNRVKMAKKHPIYGVACYMASSICFVLGVIKKDFVVWLPMTQAPDIIYIIIGFCSLCTLVVIYFPLWHILRRAQST